MFEYFPDNYGWNQSVLMALLSGGDINEIDDACRPIRDLSQSGHKIDDSVWHENWRKLGQRLEELAARDEEAGHHLSAGRKYLSASNYYIMAERHVSHLDPRKLQTYAKVLSTFKKGVSLGRQPVECVEVPYGDTSLSALYIPALSDGKAPCMVHFDGGDGVKETIYFAVGQEYRRRGISLLIVDHPGVGEALRLRNMYSFPESEIPAAACVDYLQGRADVDPDRIGIVALSLGGYYAPRAAAFEKRFKCCVAWGPCWEFESVVAKVAAGQISSSVPIFQALWIFGKDTVEEALEVARKITLEGVADKITCPLLVIHGENDRMAPLWHAERTVEAAINSPSRTLKVFTRAEGGVEHCQVDNNVLAVEYIADWVAETLGASPKGI